MKSVQQKKVIDLIGIDHFNYNFNITTKVYLFKDCMCHNPILGHSSKFIFFQNKNKKIKIKIKVSDVKKEDKGGFQKIHKNQAANLKEIQALIVPHYAQIWRKNTNLKSN